MSNEKRKIITMEDLRNSDGLEYLNLILDSISDATLAIRNLESGFYKREHLHSDRILNRYQYFIERFDKERSRLLAELGTEYLICNLDDEVRKYINDRLERIDEEPCLL